MTSHHGHTCDPARTRMIMSPWASVKDRDPWLEAICIDCGYQSLRGTPDVFPHLGECAVAYTTVIRRHAVDTYGATNTEADHIVKWARGTAIARIQTGRSMVEPDSIRVATTHPNGHPAEYRAEITHAHWVEACDIAYAWRNITTAIRRAKAKP